MANKKTVVAKVVFYDKSAKTFYSAEFYDKVPDPKWVGKNMTKALDAAALVLIQNQSGKSTKSIIVKDQVKKIRNLKDSDKAKFKKLGADV